MPAKKIIAPGIVCIALLAGLAVPAMASAASPTPATVGTHAPGHDHGLQKWLKAHRSQIRNAVLSISAKTIGLSRQDLATDLRAGQSIAAVANAHQVSTQSVVNTLVRAADAELSKIAVSHKLTAIQVTTIKQKLQSDVVKLVHHQFGHTSAHASASRAA